MNEKKISSYRLLAGGGLAERPRRGILINYSNSLFNLDKYKNTGRSKKKKLD